MDKIAKAEKTLERKIFEHGTYQLGGLFRALLKENNPAFIQVYRQAVQSGKLKMTYKDKDDNGKEYPVFSEYANLNGSPDALQSVSVENAVIVPD